MRYAGQRHPLRVRVPQPLRDRDDLRRLSAAFEREHQHFYGYTTDANVVLDTIRVRLRLPASELGEARLPDPESTAQSLRRGRTPTRKVQLAPHARATQWPVYERSALAPGATLNGPAVLVEPFATTLVDEDDAIEVDPFGNLILYVDRRF
jgi:N-methylhydantoinase A